MAGRKIHAHEWTKLDISPEMVRQEREWMRLSSTFPPKDPPLIWITSQHDYGASEDIKRLVAEIIHPKLPITP